MADLDLIDRSGHVEYNSKLVGFLYDLLKEHVSPGALEQLVRTAEAKSPSVIYSNGWLAQYAHDLALRLVPMRKSDAKIDMIKGHLKAAVDGSKTIEEATDAIYEELRSWDPVLYR
jgi:predicted ATPase